MLKGMNVIFSLSSLSRRATRQSVLLRPEDLRVEEVNDADNHPGLIGYVRERNYKGMTLDSVVEMEDGKMSWLANSLMKMTPMSTTPLTKSCCDLG